MKPLIIAANWKMHKTLEEAEEFSWELKRKLSSRNEIAIFAPYPLILAVHRILGKTKILIGAQNCHQEELGPFTGEVSAPALKNVGCKIVLLGHSERRQLFGESNALINKKIKVALKNGLKTMLCIGETDVQRKKGRTFPVLESQIRECLAGLSDMDVKKVIIAYEPVWAIGTGITATPAQAQEAHAFIRKTISNLFGKNAALQMRILYGGSVNEKNASSLFKERDIDGALVGSASLDIQKFLRISNAH